jgi:hypothetical protein
VRPGRRQGGPPFPASPAVRESDKSASTVAPSPGYRRRGALRRRLARRGAGHAPAAGRQDQLQEQATECAIPVADALGEGAQRTAHQVGHEHHLQRGLLHRHGQDAGRTGLHRGATEVPQQISEEQAAHARQRSVSEPITLLCNC